MSGDITRLINDSVDGDSEALQKLLQQVYSDLRTIARARRRNERHAGELQTTALVHEALLRIAEYNLESVNDSKHLMALASRIMRNILVDHARRLRGERRAGERIPAHESFVIDRGFNVELLDLDRAMRRLAARFPRLERIVECRFFGGMSNEETAVALDISSRTVKRDWVRARTYLLQSLQTERART